MLRLHAADIFELQRPQPLPHRHDWHELVYIITGRYRARTRSTVLDGGPGASFCYPAGFWHQPLRLAPQPTRIVLLRWHGEGPARPLMAQDHGGPLLSALYWLWELAHDPATPRPVLDALLLTVLHERERQPAQPADEAVARAERYLSANLAYPLSLGELARVVGLSRAQLNRRFRAALRESPMRYRLRRRVERAIDLIRTTPQPLAAIAGAVGLSEASHLSRLVKAVSGRTPTQWRSGRAGGAP